MDAVSAIVGPVVKLLAEHITRKLRNLTSYADRVKEMKDKMKVLDGQRVDNDEHLRRNRENNKQIPARLPGWFEEVENIKKEVENIPCNDIGCFNVKKKYLAGKNALAFIKDIDRLSTEEIIWTDADIPLGRVDSESPPSTSTSTSAGNTQIVFKSRDKIFDDALKFLQQDDDKPRVIALCGMGGVGKTTLMKQLKEAAHDNKMFNWIMVVAVGKSPNLFKIQEVIAAHTGKPLTETDETLRATRLSKRFGEFSKRKEKSLVILDDVWETINLEDIGLASPLPNGVKLLLTSRDVKVCQQIAADVDAHSAFKVVEVDVLEVGEAQDFFFQFAGNSAKDDSELYGIGCDIVRKCGCLPLAIKLIAGTLKSEKNKGVWRRTLKCLKNNDLHKNVQEIVEMSYNNLKQEDKEIFLLCGLFPEDSNIPIEDLTRYAWGLKLLNKVSTMEEARDSTQTSVSNLKNAYLLMDGDRRHTECVKLHDLVLAFVVNTVSKGGDDGCWIIYHKDDFSNWSEANSMSQSCKQISLSCKGMSEFPTDFKFPDLSLLKLVQGDKSLRFPQAFYATMENLQVIAFERMKYPVVPTSSVKLRTLCLDECSLIFDLTCIGNLLNLEVLSFANSCIEILPSTFGNLKKLRLLDVRGCCNLVIDDGVLKGLVKLEELYMIPYHEESCCFTDNNSREFAERSENLKRFKLSVGCSITEVREHVQTYEVDMDSYENSLKLVTNRKELLKSKINKLFMITDALHLQVNDMNSLEDVEIPDPPRNSSFSNLRLLVVSECTKLKYLFTPSIAKNLAKLEYLDISGCPIMEAVIDTGDNGFDIIKFSNLKYLRLDRLPNLLCFCNNDYVIVLPRLMELQLEGLPNFTSIYPSSASSSVSSNISHMQSFFHEEDATPNLEELIVYNMENLKEIWPPRFSISNLCPLRMLMVKGCCSIEVLFSMDFGEIEQLSSSLRSIIVEGCFRLVKLFSCNPFPFLNNLQQLNVESCRSIKVLFDIDSGSTGNIGEQVCTSSLRSIVVKECESFVNLLPRNPMPLFNHLEELEVLDCASIEMLFDIDMGCVGQMDKVSCRKLSIKLERLGKLREVWRIKAARNNLIHGFEAVESILIEECESFENLITPATTNLDMRALKEVKIHRCGRESERNNELAESNQDQETNAMSILGEDSNNEISKIAFPSSLLPTFHNLHKLDLLLSYEDAGVVFEITSPISRELAHNTQQQLIILPNLEELDLYALERMSHVWKCNWNEFLILQKQPSQSSFQNLTTITMYHCNSIKYLFSPLMAKLLSSLKKVDIQHCYAIEEVVSNRYDISCCDGIEEIVSNTDDEDASINSHTTTTFFPRLDLLFFWGLTNFKCIGGGVNGISSDIHEQLKPSQASWSLCQYAREIKIIDCDALSSVIPWYAVRQMQIDKKVFETQEINKSGTDTDTKKSLPRLEYITMLKLPKLKILKIQGCNLLKHIFTFSTFESLAELEELVVRDCKAMEIIVAEENGEQTSASVGVVFPHVKSLSLVNLPNFVGFFLGKNEFKWPALEKVVIVECPQITVFTYGQSTAPKLKFINTSLGKHSVECGLNFHVTTTQARLPSYESTSSYRPTTMEQLPWSYHNLIEMDDMDYKPHGGQTLFSSDEVSQLQNLETVHCKWLDVEEIFDSQTGAEIPNLRQVDLKGLRSLKYIWKSKQGTELKFPNLTRLSIQYCSSLEYVFTCPMVSSISQLQELHIDGCRSMKVIVKGEEESDAIVDATVKFPCLKSLKLVYLDSLEGFCLGKEAYSFPSLDTLEIKECSKLTPREICLLRTSLKGEEISRD